MSETDRRQDQVTRTPRRATPVASVGMLLVGGVVWFFLYHLVDWHPVLDVVVAAVVALGVGFVAQELVGRWRR